jgi:hypothetical protein
MSAELDKSAESPTDIDAAAIIQALDNCRGEIPEAAMRQCQQHREQMIPHLIRAIQRATERVENGDEPIGNSHWIAVYLLWEFEAQEALPAILTALALPEEGTYELFGDGITEHFEYILATLVGDRLEIIDDMIDLFSLDEYVRSAAMKVYPVLVRDERMSRAEAVERLRRHLRTAIACPYSTGTEWLICELCKLNPQEAVAEIREAFERERVGEMTIDLSYAENWIARGESGMQDALRMIPPTKLEDAVEFLRESPFFFNEVDDDGDDFDNFEDDESLWAEADGPDIEERAMFPGPSATIRNEGPRIGRNDPCPCGSGKKYKKCCLRSDQSGELDALL